METELNEINVASEYLDESNRDTDYIEAFNQSKLPSWDADSDNYNSLHDCTERDVYRAYGCMMAECDMQNIPAGGIREIDDKGVTAVIDDYRANHSNNLTLDAPPANNFDKEMILSEMVANEFVDLDHNLTLRKKVYNAVISPLCDSFKPFNAK